MAGATEGSGEVRSIPLELIDASPYQPRLRFDEEKLAELAASIRRHGFIQPVVLRAVGARYQLVAGERRVRAARMLGLREVPALVRRYTDEQAQETALIENLQREDISVVEEARAYERLIAEFGYTQTEVAERTGKSRAAVNNTLRLLQLPEPVLELLDQGELSEGHARALLTLPYPSLQCEVAEWIVRNAVTVREAEQKARALAQPAAPAGRQGPAAARPDAHVAAREERLRRHLETRVELTYRAGRGELTIEFYSDDDLCRILELLGL